MDSKKGSDTAKRLPPNAGKGRPKGALNKTTKAAKDAIALAAEGLGGAERLQEWALESPENERAFWVSIYPKLIPVTLAGDKENPLEMVGSFKLVPLK
jgi:hypothetical protein